MGKATFFSKIYNWLKTTEMFEKPSSQIPGKWQLYEYFFEPDKELINIKKEQLQLEKQYCIIEFDETNKYSYIADLQANELNNIKDGTWSISQNYITLIHPEDFRKNLEFQFAFEKGNLKLLKKDSFGKIIFFGFFNRL